MAETLEELEAGYATLGSELAEIASKVEVLILGGTGLGLDRERLVDDRVLPIILADGADAFERTNEIDGRVLDASLAYLDQVLMLRQMLARVEGTDPGEVSIGPDEL